VVQSQIENHTTENHSNIETPTKKSKKELAT